MFVTQSSILALENENRFHYKIVISENVYWSGFQPE